MVGMDREKNRVICAFCRNSDSDKNGERKSRANGRSTDPNTSFGVVNYVPGLNLPVMR